jgi:hypothetical protein
VSIGSDATHLSPQSDDGDAVHQNRSNDDSRKGGAGWLVAADFRGKPELKFCARRDGRSE